MLDQNEKPVATLAFRILLLQALACPRPCFQCKFPATMLVDATFAKNATFDVGSEKQIRSLLSTEQRPMSVKSNQ